jgi:holin-like protein
VLGALTVLLVCQLAGEVLARALALPLPGPVVGTSSSALRARHRMGVPGDLHDTAQGLLSHLSLLFVPAGVGIVLHVARIRSEWLAFVSALVLSSLVTLVVTALVFRLVARLIDGEKGEGA